MRVFTIIMVSTLSLIFSTLVAEQVDTTGDQDTSENQPLVQSEIIDTPNAILEPRATEQTHVSGSRSTLVDPDTYEPDNTAAACRIINVSSVAQSQNHTIHTTGDQDWYRFMIYEGRACRFVVTGISVQLALFLDDGVTPAPTTGNYIANQQWEIFSSGNFKLRVIGASGATGAYTITYSYVAAADEYEPDDSAGEHSGLGFNVGVDGYQYHSLHTFTDWDWLLFYAYVGGTYTIWSTGNTDVRIYLYKVDGTTLIMQDEDSGEANNFSITYTPVEDEICFVRISGNTPYAIGNYTIHTMFTVLSDAYEPDNSINQFTPLSIATYDQTQKHNLHNATDQDWYGFSAVQGTTYSFFSTSDTGLYWGGLYKNDGTIVAYSQLTGEGGRNFMIEYTATTTEYMKVKVTVVQGITNGFYRLHYLKWVPADAYEPDDTAAEAQAININEVEVVQTHTLKISNNIPDQDWYQFSALYGYTYRFYSLGNTDTEVFIYQQDGVTLLCSDDESGGDHNFAINFIPACTAVYKLKVAGFSSGVMGYYDIHYWMELGPDSYEPDNSNIQYTAITPSTDMQNQTHNLHASQDEDWFRFYARADMIYTFSSYGSTDTRILMYQDNGTTLITGDDDGGSGYNFNLEFVPDTSANFKFMVDGYSGATGVYQLNYQCRNALTAPTDLSISSAGDQITLTWSVVPNVSGYRIEASDNPNTGFTQVGTTSDNTWTATANSSRKFYRVIALR